MNRVIRMVLRGWDDVSEIVMSACTGAMAAISPAVLGPSVPLSLCLTRPGVGERGAGAEACSTAASNCSSNCSAGARTSLQPLTAGGGGGARVASGRGQQTETRGPWLRSNCVRRETWLLNPEIVIAVENVPVYWPLLMEPSIIPKKQKMLPGWYFLWQKINCSNKIYETASLFSFAHQKNQVECILYKYDLFKTLWKNCSYRYGSVLIHFRLPQKEHCSRIFCFELYHVEEKTVSQ